MDDAIAILVPVLGRPHRVQPLMRNVAEVTRAPYRLLFIASPGDNAELLELCALRADFHIHEKEVGPGNYAQKINEGYRFTIEPYIFTGADDLLFHPGWDSAALEKFHDPDIGFVGTNDLGNPKVLAGSHSTHSLVARWYADQYGVIDNPGAIYCELYPHEFCDDEAVNTAKLRGAWAFARDSKVEHLHPHWSKAPMDHLYAQADARLQKGRIIYRQRRRLWTDPRIRSTYRRERRRG